MSTQTFPILNQLSQMQIYPKPTLYAPFQALLNHTSSIISPLSLQASLLRSSICPALNPLLLRLHPHCSSHISALLLR